MLLLIEQSDSTTETRRGRKFCCVPLISRRKETKAFFFVEKKQNKTRSYCEKSDYLLVNSHFCCNLAALNFDTLFGGSWGGGGSGATSSCFLSRMVGRAGGAMVRCGTAKGIGSFSTTVPEKAFRGEREREKPRLITFTFTQTGSTLQSEATEEEFLLF